MKKKLKNCEVCFASYAPYETGEKEDIGAGWCVLSTVEENGEATTNGVCQFHNPRSRLYLGKQAVHIVGESVDNEV